MSEIPKPQADGCLICLVQASDSMGGSVIRAPVATKIAAALGWSTG